MSRETTVFLRTFLFRIPNIPWLIEYGQFVNQPVTNISCEVEIDLSFNKKKIDKTSFGYEAGTVQL